MESGLVVGTSLAAMLFSKVDKPTAINKISIVYCVNIKSSKKILSLPETRVYTNMLQSLFFSRMVWQNLFYLEGEGFMFY